MRERIVGSREGAYPARVEKGPEGNRPLSEIIHFGEALIRTGDLDPVYIAIHEAKLPYKQLARLLLAYWCFYHLGVSAWLSEFEGGDFWHFMKAAAANKYAPRDPHMHWEHGKVIPDFGKWPRGSERRHFRGPKCVKAIDYLRTYPNRPEDWVEGLTQYSSVENIINNISEWPLFGLWIGFKAADMLERCYGHQVEFPDNLLLFYKEPRAGLDLLAIPAEEAAKKLIKHFARFSSAPPNSSRRCNVQEVETIACKFKSFLGGHYYVGKDIHEVRKGLVGWGDTASRMLQGMPPEVPETGKLF